MSQSANILIAEDEHRIAEVIVAYLEQAGFAVTHVDDGGKVLEAIDRQPPDLLVLDLMLPNKDGISICRELRAFSQLPVIMVTAKVEEIDRLLGFEVGADDYLCKPFSPRELVARVQSLLRRSGPANEPLPQLFSIDGDARRVSCNGTALQLTPTEYSLMELFLSRPGRVFPRAQLIDLVYEDAIDTTDRAIDSHIKNLRKKIAAHLPDQEVIRSVYGIGYRYEL